MKDVEAARRGLLEMADVIGDAAFDHGCDARAGGRSHHRDRGSERRAKEAAAGGIRRVYHRFMTQPGQSVGKLEGMYDTAARIGRVGENGNSQWS